MNALWRWLTASREDAEIGALTARELRDIGLNHYDLVRRDGRYLPTLRRAAAMPRWRA